MKHLLIFFLSSVSFVAGFTLPTTTCSSSTKKQIYIHAEETSKTVLHNNKKKGYVPDGFTEFEWKVQQAKDRRAKRSKHNEHFVSRSLQSFQEELEKGRVRHLFPTMFAKERLKSHDIEPRDIPYMQRGHGFADNHDVNVGYVPDGMTPHQWHDIQRKEKDVLKSKDFTTRGPTNFKSRSLQSFQEDLQKGKATHLMPVMFAEKQLKSGNIKEEDIPYMQRGGKWDNSDVRGAKNRLQWSETDRMYEKGEGPFQKVDEPKNKNKFFFGLFP